MSLYVIMIVFFCFFYTAVTFKPDDVAENLKKNGGFIPGIRPGKKTAEFIDKVLTRLTVVGAIYLSSVCVLPTILDCQSSIFLFILEEQLFSLLWVSPLILLLRLSRIL